MAAIFKALWSRIAGGGGGAPDEGPAVEYNGYRIRPTPYRRQGQYQTCGIIEKAVGGETREHRFIRAELHPNREAAVAFSIDKAKQIIDEQGQRLFN
jgi:hypothetical protein